MAGWAEHTNSCERACVCVCALEEGGCGVGWMGWVGVCQQIPPDLDSHHTHSAGGGEDSDLAHADTQAHTKRAMSVLRKHTNKHAPLRIHKNTENTQTEKGRERDEGIDEGRKEVEGR